jgi:hypothetical protein
LAGFLDHVADVAGPVVAAASGRVAVELTVGLPGQVPLIDVAGTWTTTSSRSPSCSVLGEDPLRPFHPRDDRIVRLGLHQHVTSGIGHYVIIDAWWTSQ